MPDKGTRVFLLGQTLMTEDMRSAAPESFGAMKRYFSETDAIVTNFEPALLLPGLGEVTRKDGTPVHAAPIETLDAMEALGINLVSAVSNHTWDRGTESLLASVPEFAKRGMVIAGIGDGEGAASRAGVLALPKIKIALVAMATGKIREGARATSARGGVNELRMDDPETLCPEDSQRILEEIAKEKRQQNVVVAVHHNHCWGEDKADTPPWLQAWAHTCVDAGCDIFLGHGAPLLQGIEVYQQKLICYNLGSFVFNCSSKEKWPDPAFWRTLSVECTLSDAGKIVQARVSPLVLDRENPAYGFPFRAEGAEGQEIVRSIQRVSFEKFGTDILFEAGDAYIQL